LLVSILPKKKKGQAQFVRVGGVGEKGKSTTLLPFWNEVRTGKTLLAFELWKLFEPWGGGQVFQKKPARGKKTCKKKEPIVLNTKREGRGLAFNTIGGWV